MGRDVSVILCTAMVHGFGHASTYILLMYGCSRAEQGPDGLVKNGGIRINLNRARGADILHTSNRTPRIMMDLETSVSCHALLPPVS